MKSILLDLKAHVLAYPQCTNLSSLLGNFNTQKRPRLEKYMLDNSASDAIIPSVPNLSTSSATNVASIFTILKTVMITNCSGRIDELVPSLLENSITYSISHECGSGDGTRISHAIEYMKSKQTNNMKAFFC